MASIKAIDPRASYCTWLVNSGIFLDLLDAPSNQKKECRKAVCNRFWIGQISSWFLTRVGLWQLAPWSCSWYAPDISPFSRHAPLFVCRLGLPAAWSLSDPRNRKRRSKILGPYWDPWCEVIFVFYLLILVHFLGAIIINEGCIGSRVERPSFIPLTW